LPDWYLYVRRQVCTGRTQKAKPVLCCNSRTVRRSCAHVSTFDHHYNRSQSGWCSGFAHRLATWHPCCDIRDVPTSHGGQASRASSSWRCCSPSKKHWRFPLWPYSRPRLHGNLQWGFKLLFHWRLRIRNVVSHWKALHIRRCQRLGVETKHLIPSPEIRYRQRV
jgi:hypothetical protein